MSDMIVQCFTCCVTQRTQSKRRRTIDRSMIGSPTNFRHTAHVGSGGMRVHLDSIQDQMASKGGYDAVSYDHSSLPISVNIPLVDVEN